MKVRAAVGLFITAMFLSLPAAAQEQIPKRQGAGASECAALIKLNALALGDNHMSWAIGYITGLAWADEQRAVAQGKSSRLAENVLARTDAQLVDSVKNVCVNNPSRTLFEAADYVVGALNSL